MKEFSKKYATVQIDILNIEKMAYTYQDNEAQNDTETEKIIESFKKLYTLFCELLGEYLIAHHKGFIPGATPRDTIIHAHKAGFLSEYDSKILLEADNNLKAVRNNEESPLIHSLETYTQTMQTIMSNIKPL